MKRFSPSKNNSESGNAIVIILVAISLFAALSYAFSNTSRTSSSYITEAEADAYAGEIIAYGNDLRQAIKRLLLRGCAKSEISLENNFELGHGASPKGPECHVFLPEGGGITYLNQNPKSNTSTPVHTNYLFNRNNTWVDQVTNERVGSFTGELVLLAEISPAVCKAINEKLGLDFPPLRDNNGWNNHNATRFDGTFANAETGNAYPVHIKSACLQYGLADAYEDKYYYYKYLIIN